MTPLDETIRTAVSRLGVVRVSGALNPLLYMTMVMVPTAWGCAWLFREDKILQYGFVGLGAIFALGFLLHYTRFALSDPDRLQSEEYLVRKQELSMIERKGRTGPKVVEARSDGLPTSQDDTPPAMGEDCG